MELQLNCGQVQFDLNFGRNRICYPVDRVFVIEPKIIVIRISKYLIVTVICQIL